MKVECALNEGFLKGGEGARDLAAKAIKVLGRQEGRPKFRM